MTELQSRLVDILKWFHDFCERNNLKYYVLGGTMLGAMRHKGFIPWDDDIDVGMPRNDYEKLMSIMKDDIFDDKFILEQPLKNKGYIYPYCKIYDITTTLIENAKVKVKRGIYIDVFPLDGIGNSAEEAESNFKEINRLNTLTVLKVAGFRKGRKFYKNLGVALFRLVPLNVNKMLKKIVKKCPTYSFDESLYCGNLVGNWGKREIVPRDVMGSPTLYEFENMRVYGAEKPDEYLTSLYGDWRKLPPKEKQITHHDFLMCDLSKSYLEN